MKEMPLARHHGIFRRQITLLEAIALIVSGTVGAGVLGIPFAIANVGMLPGLALIGSIGLLMIGVNLLVADIAAAAGAPYQLPGLAEKFLGVWGKWLMTSVIYFALFGALLVYIIGEGETLAALFGGSPFVWSIGFFVVATTLIFFGLRTVKTIEVFLMLGMLTVVVLITSVSIPHIQPAVWGYANLAELFLPYGVLVFAFHGTTAVAEAHSIMVRREALFKKAVLIAGGIVIAVYVVFTAVVVGVMGEQTPEIATVGLGQAIGPVAAALANLFAALTMGTTFLMAGVSMRDSFRWDFHLPSSLATTIVCGVPFLLFLLGLRGFLQTIDLVGGVFMTVEIALIVLMWIRARRR